MEVLMIIGKSIQVGVLSLCLAAPVAMARTHHRVTRDTQVVDVNAHIIPPGPPHARHVIIVNSAARAPRHHGVAGMFQRLHIWHMRQRAHVYKGLYGR
jgi:hypothetical protein